MATTVSYFLDTIDFSAATAVFTDIDLTTKAPDGFYKYGTFNRQQLSGLLQTGVECSTLSPCNLLNQFTMNYGPTCVSACTVVNSVEWFGDPYYGYGGDPSGGGYVLNGTVEIIGDPVTFRGFAAIPDNAGPGSFSTGIYIGPTDYRYVEIVRPRDVNFEAYSSSFTLPAGTYTWQVYLNWFGTGGLGEGGITFVQ